METNTNQTTNGLIEHGWRGAVGAVLLSLLAGGIYVFLSRMSFWIAAAVSGYLCMIFAAKGYSLLTRTETSMRGMKISVIVSCVVMTLAWYIGFALDMHILLSAHFDEVGTFLSFLPQAAIYLLNYPLTLLHLMIAIATVMASYGRALKKAEKKNAPKQEGEKTKPRSLHRIDEE